MQGYSLELCAGAGGQALGLEQAGFEHVGLVEIDPHACATLRLNRPEWCVHEDDLNTFDARLYKGIDLVAGGFPCPPFSIAGKQLGADDDRDLFPIGLRIADEVRPKAIMIENVKGLLSPRFEDYRCDINSELEKLGYRTFWKLLNAADYGVAQLRPRVLIVALRKPYADNFSWPSPARRQAKVGSTLIDLMKTRGWRDADAWKDGALSIGPTIVGGSKKHGGPDLGPTRARKAWAELGVDGLGIANDAPDEDFSGMPRLTNRMVARLQGFPDSWQFSGKKTNTYRQIGNAMPAPLANAVSKQIAIAINKGIKNRPVRSQQSQWQAALL